jgi:hypothetical protein
VLNVARRTGLIDPLQFILAVFLCYILLLRTISILAGICLSSLKFPYEGGFLNFGKRIDLFGQNPTKEHILSHYFYALSVMPPCRITLFGVARFFSFLIKSSIWINTMAMLLNAHRAIVVC